MKVYQDGRKVLLTDQNIFITKEEDITKVTNKNDKIFQGKNDPATKP